MNPSWEAGVLGLQVKVGRHNCLVEFFCFLEYIFIYLSIYLDPPRVSNVQPARSVFMWFRGTTLITLQDSGNIYIYIHYTYIYLYLHTHLYTDTIHIYIYVIYIYTLKSISHGSTHTFFQVAPMKVSVGMPQPPPFFGGSILLR